MTPTRIFCQAVLFVAVFLPPLLGSACSGKEENPSGHVQEAGTQEQYAGPAWSALALLKTGTNPLWFELAPDGPALIESPAAATLTPYAPWPHARFVVGTRLWQDFLVMAVNRYGFLILGPGGTDSAAASSDAAADPAAPLSGDGTVLYRAADSARWAPYTAESFFVWNGKPSVLLYRSDFFSEPAASPPESQVYVLDESSPVPVPASVPALESYPPGGFWETEAVRRGSGGLWYYRMKEKGRPNNETAYFRTGNLEEAGAAVSAAEWRNSEAGEAPETMPPALAAVLARAAGLETGTANTESAGSTAGASTAPGRGAALAVRAVSPDFEGERLFRGGNSGAGDGAAGSENTALLYGYCRETPEPLAFAVFPDGSGFFAREANTGNPGSGAKPFSLPALPDGFVYSGVALMGNVLAASWEEQQDAGVGAAGFMVLPLDAIQPRG